jgi:hypothetical protein
MHCVFSPALLTAFYIGASSTLHDMVHTFMTWCTPMKQLLEAGPPIRKQIEDTLRRARQLPVGPYRNDLRQLAEGPRGLEKLGPDERAQELTR